MTNPAIPIQIPDDFTYVGNSLRMELGPTLRHVSLGKKMINHGIQWGLRQTHFTSSKKPCGVPNRGVPNRGVPSRGVPEPGVRNRGVPERGVPERGVPTRGVPIRGTGGSVIYTAREEC